MRGLNKVMIIGQLGRDPEMRYTPNGKAVTSLLIETRREWKSAEGERHTESEWFTVVAWGNLAEICKQRLFKGQYAYFEGRLQTRSWEDDNGKRHHRTEIIASEMLVLSERYDPHQSHYHDIGDSTDAFNTDVA
ncbi:MAG: single-stranded DNA-binding protein [Anaerolineae bacterium]|nr:single-stranded DNA-binding protein [Anaerolineae bacterium]